MAAVMGEGAAEVARSGRGLLDSGSANATSKQRQVTLQVALEQRRGPGSGHEGRRDGSARAGANEGSVPDSAGAPDAKDAGLLSASGGALASVGSRMSWRGRG